MLQFQHFNLLNAYFLLQKNILFIKGKLKHNLLSEKHTFRNSLIYLTINKLVQISTNLIKAQLNEHVMEHINNIKLLQIITRLIKSRNDQIFF